MRQVKLPHHKGGQARPQRLAKHGGQVIIESVVAISIGLVGLVGFLYLLTQSIGIAKDAATKLVATYLAAEGVETVKGIIDLNHVAGDTWNAGLTDGSDYRIQYDSTSLIAGGGSTPLRLDTSTGLYTYGSGDVTPYRRAVRIVNMRSSREMQVVSTVTWAKRGGGEDDVSVEEHFFDWRPALE